MTYRPIARADRAEYLAMAHDFYASEAVLHAVPDSHFEETFAELMRSDVYAQAYILETNGQTIGYALLAKSFSQEAGGVVLWIEELYIKPPYRACGYGSRFLREFLGSLPPQVKRVRLEAERENDRAVRLYESLGFTFLDYDQMVIDRSI